MTITTIAPMTVDNPILPINDMGVYSFDQFALSYVWMSASMGNVVQYWNPDYLYEVDGYYLRTNALAYLNYNNTGVYKTYIYNLQWNNNLFPPTAGNYDVLFGYSARRLVCGRSLCMIGDSITWANYGGWWRNLLRENGVLYDFAGQHYDPFGFQHSAEGGNSTSDVLARLSAIPAANAYFILVGTDDRYTDNGATTFANLQSIVSQLRARDCCNTVYISTLLPRNDSYNTQNSLVNNMIKAGVWDSRTHVVDSGGLFTNLLNNNTWATLTIDGVLHPSLYGYELLSSLIAPYIV